MIQKGPVTMSDDTKYIHLYVLVVYTLLVYMCIVLVISEYNIMQCFEFY